MVPYGGVGRSVGACVGMGVGYRVGILVGKDVGYRVGYCVGDRVGAGVGKRVCPGHTVPSDKRMRSDGPQSEQSVPAAQMLTTLPGPPS